MENSSARHHHEILRIQIGHGAKFKLKMTILIFWTKFAKNGISRL